MRLFFSGRPNWSLVLLMVLALIVAGCEYGNGNKTKDKIFKVCALASACGAEVTGGMTNGCWWQYYIYSMLYGSKGTYEHIVLTRFECWRQAEDCDAFNACHEVIPEQNELCVLDPQLGYGDICVDNTVIGCSSRTFSDCESAGLVCAQNEYYAECGVDTCDPVAYESRCDGDMLVYCDSSGALIEAHCSEHHSLICGTNLEGELDCIGAGEDCSDGYNPHCEGTVMVRCSGGKRFRLDCQEVIPNTTCLDLDDDFWNLMCVPEKECPSDFTEETCENGVITFCWMGELTTLDCREYGLSGCRTEGAAAACTP